jgi:hypothetical protein
MKERFLPLVEMTGGEGKRKKLEIRRQKLEQARRDFSLRSK